VAVGSEESLPLLTRRACGDDVVVVQIAPLAGDASTRRYVRLFLDGPGAPPSIVAMLLADRAVAMSSDELASLPADLRELPYMNVHRFLERVGVRVPQVLLDASDAGVLLLEDIGDTTLWAVASAASPGDVRHWYARAIDSLVQLQLAESRASDPQCIAFAQAFDRRLVRWELDHFIEWGIERHLGHKLPAADADVLGPLFDAIADEFDQLPRTLNHRDFHSWNLHIHEGEIRVIDFQDALMAPIPYDLATLLGDRDTPNVVTPDIEAVLLNYYRERWANAGGAALEAQKFERSYFLCALQKALKVVGRFHYLHLEKGKPGYLRYLPATVRQLRRVAGRLPDMQPLLPILDRYLPPET